MAHTPPGQTRERIFRFVRDRLLDGRPPTVREVRDELGFRAVESARSHLTALVKEGRLRYQVEGQPVGEIGLHETTYLPRGVRHWHGAVPDEELTHVSVTFPDAAGEPLPIEWMEPVTDPQYTGAPGQ